MDMGMDRAMDRDARAVPTLVAGDLVLRAWREADLSFVMSAARDDDIRRFSSVGTSVSPDAATRWIASRHAHDRVDWLVEHGEAPVGRVSLAHIDPNDDVAEVGYWVMPQHRRRGIASAAVAAAEDYAFDTLHLIRLYIRHEPDNEASCAVASSRGYLAEGTQRGAFTRAGARRDLHVHGLLATDDVVLKRQRR